MQAPVLPFPNLYAVPLELCVAAMLIRLARLHRWARYTITLQGTVDHVLAYSAWQVRHWRKQPKDVRYALSMHRLFQAFGLRPSPLPLP